MSYTSTPKYKQHPIPTLTVTSPSIASVSLKSPRTARFAEDTAVNSPIDGTTNPFKDPPTNHYKPQRQVSDIGFGYLNEAAIEHVEMEETDQKYITQTVVIPAPLKSPPLKSALKTPGAPPRNIEAILSPTFQHEEVLEKNEAITAKEQKKDLRAKIRVRWAKLVLRGVNFGCSLIVLAMLATTFQIFNATKSLASRNSLPAWASGTTPWPQILLLVIACISLFGCLCIFWSYWRGGHKRAEKVAVYYTTFAVVYFAFSIIMWIVGAAILNNARNNSNGKDVWGWSCKENQRRNIFQDDVDYALICRLQNWSLICALIEIVVEVFAIIIYGIVFWRYYTKRRLRKTMEARDRARSDLYLAQLRMQSAPNTPGLPGGLLSPRDGGWKPPQGYTNYNDEKMMEEGDSSRFVTVGSAAPAPKPFTLKAPPMKASKQPTVQNQEKDSLESSDDEPVYGSVTVPGAYAGQRK